MAVATCFMSHRRLGAQLHWWTKLTGTSWPFYLGGDKNNHTPFHLVGGQSVVGAKLRWPYSMRCENEAYNQLPDMWTPGPEIGATALMWLTDWLCCRAKARTLLVPIATGSTQAKIRTAKSTQQEPNTESGWNPALQCSGEWNFGCLEVWAFPINDWAVAPNLQCPWEEK